MPIVSWGPYTGSDQASNPDLDLHGEPFIDLLKKQYPNELGLADAVRGITQGQMPATGRNLQRLMPLAAQYEPGFDYQTYQQRQKAFNDWYGGGKSQQIVKRIDQATRHTESLINDIENLGNFGLGKVVNYPFNEVENLFGGNVHYKPLETNAHALADELAGIWKGANLSDTEIKKWGEAFPVNGSIPQQKASIAKLMELMTGGTDSLEDQRQTSFGRIAGKLSPAVTPQMQERIDRVKAWAEDPQAKWGAQQPGAQQPAAPAAAPRPGNYIYDPKTRQIIQQ